MQAENKNGVLAPVVCAVEHKKGKDGNRYLASASSLDNKKESKITEQFKKWCTVNTIRPPSSRQTRRRAEPTIFCAPQ